MYLYWKSNFRKLKLCFKALCLKYSLSNNEVRVLKYNRGAIWTESLFTFAKWWWSVFDTVALPSLFRFVWNTESLPLTYWILFSSLGRTVFNSGGLRKMTPHLSAQSSLLDLGPVGGILHTSVGHTPWTKDFHRFFCSPSWMPWWPVELLPRH